MPVTLEERLRAAGRQMDRQIEQHATMPERAWAPQSRPPGQPLRLALVASAAVLLIVGLAWVTGRGDGAPATAPAPDTVLADVTAVSPTVVPIPTDLPIETDVPVADNASGEPAAPSTTVIPMVETTVPVEFRAPIAIGESVMLGAVPQLRAGGFTVYAEASRQADDMAVRVAQLRDANQIGRTVVLQVGTNGPVSAQQYDAIMAFLPAAEVPKVVFLTVHAPKPYIAANNVEIWSLPARYSNVTVLDWDGLSGQIENELSGSDGGVHLRTENAKQFYANYIFSAIGHNELVQPME